MCLEASGCETCACWLPKYPQGKMAMHKININMDKKCIRCGKGGAADGGYCLKCVLKNMKEGKYDHILRKRVGENESTV